MSDGIGSITIVCITYYQYESAMIVVFFFFYFLFFQAEDGIRDLVRSRGLGDVYKRQMLHLTTDSFMLYLSPL